MIDRSLDGQKKPLKRAAFFVGACARNALASQDWFGPDQSTPALPGAAELTASGELFGRSQVAAALHRLAPYGKALLSSTAQPLPVPVPGASDEFEPTRREAIRRNEEKPPIKASFKQ
ncbi:hypothetical protein M3O57_08130 [Xanthomonas nasturtii]|uniref:hypothetical protein n=1 Tax=Xanthomonas nasturtii TaxID=1843581 RepID=UPI0011C04A22|nr:hypothetical protein [Xanthomonas nasturtii]MCL1530345.1 hypothetical protein [Xanthomonas nasturtii]MCL1565491.1 hypothetical protein [Xanthomonas nasturtii]MCL1569433.1 hypothetical protein [Xanthomonas nasturtii]MCL1573259.1 hypothetical protein [Xanthomonas nasturtii]MCL1580671.1 hypothetical protein [Xanthomonas nasturtii]